MTSTRECVPTNSVGRFPPGLKHFETVKVGFRDNIDANRRGKATVGEADERKQRSIDILRTEGVPINEHLPVVETEDQAVRRSAIECTQRAMALFVVAVKAYGHGIAEPHVVRNQTSGMIAQLDLSGVFTPDEQRFIDNDEPIDKDRIAFSWRHEALWVLLWALNFVDDLGRPDKTCDVRFVDSLLRDRGRTRFISDSRLRTQREILDAADLIYRYHWAVRDARIRGESVESLNSGVVVERHYALNWLIGYLDQAWDDITTDT